MPWTYDVSREGPFDAYCSPMDTGDLLHPWFLEFIGAPESARLLYRSPAFWVQRMVKRMLWRPLSTFSGTPE